MNKTGGFTLVEVCIALLIVSIIATAGLELAFNSSKISAISEDNIITTFAADYAGECYYAGCLLEMQKEPAIAESYTIDTVTEISERGISLKKINLLSKMGTKRSFYIPGIN